MSYSTVTWVYGNERLSEPIKHGANLMMAAQDLNVPSIAGECGGCLSCATCHVVVADAWVDRVNQVIGRAQEVEEMMLEITTTPRQANSRLSCQLIAHAQLDGLELIVPIEA
jgi:ferredoxin, 2Fe-2S